LHKQIELNEVNIEVLILKFSLLMSLSLPAYSCVRQIHTLQSSLIIKTKGVKNLMILYVTFGMAYFHGYQNVYLKVAT